MKPGNLLCDGSNRRLRLIDFGSAADLDPSPIPSDKGNALGNLFSGGMQRVGYDEGIVAISPVYSAPETFVKLEENPLAFDVFSAGLIMSQLLFNLLDERSELGLPFASDLICLLFVSNFFSFMIMNDHSRRRVSPAVEGS